MEINFFSIKKIDSTFSQINNNNNNCVDISKANINKLNTYSLSFNVEDTDDYRNGPDLFISNVKRNGNFIDSDDEKNSENEDYADVILDDIPLNKYNVYIGRVECGCMVDFLCNFDNFEDAKHYCGEQFYLLHASFPFIPNGKFSGAYHPEGNRPEIRINKKARLRKLVEKSYNSDCSAHFMIIYENDIYTYSLNPFSVWD